MATAKKSAKKKSATQPAKSQLKQGSLKKKLSPKIKSFLRRRSSSNSVHRSFRRTYRRDYVRPLGLPGYIPFTAQVLKTLWQYRSVFIQLIVVYAVVSGLLVGLISQSTYSELGNLIRSTSDEVFAGDMGKITEAGTLLIVGLSGGLSGDLSESDQLIASLLALLAWLITIWMLRALLAGHNPRVRDGFYSAGAPIVPTALLAIVIVLQLVPAAIATIAISAAIPLGLVSEGIEAMLFWVAAVLLGVLSLYWITSTLIALVVVTLPGMYPMRALKSAQELVEDRRLPILLRFLWLLALTAILWALFMIPIILFDAWLKGVWQSIDWLPIVPVAWLLASSASIVWATSYIYLLYRRVVDNDTRAT